MRGRKLINPVHRSWEPSQLHVRVARDSPGGVVTNSTSCQSCSYGVGDLTDQLTVDLGGGFMAYEAYKAVLFCENIATIVYNNYSGGVWTGTADLMTVECNGDTVTWTSSLTYFNHLPGNGTSTGLLIQWSDGTDTWKWKNRTAWQPILRVEMELFAGPTDCPCAPFVDFTCLIPIEAPDP